MRRSRRCAISPSRAEDAARLREAIAAAAGSRLQEAKACATRSPTRPARKLVDWYLLPWRIWHGRRDSRLPRCQSGLAGARPADPARRGGAVQRRRRARATSRPSSPAPSPGPPSAMPRWRRAHLADKDEAKAKALAQQGLDRSRHARRPSSPAFLRLRRRRCSTEADHKRRLDRLLLNDTRWAGERNERAAVIRRVIALLSEEEKKKAEARLAVFLRAKNSQTAPVQAAGALAGRLGPRRAEGPGPAPPEEGGGGLEDPAGGAGRRRGQRQAGRLVGGAARQRLCGAAARQAQDGLRPRAQSRARSPSTPARTRPSSRAGWRCATSRTPSWRSAISRRWPRPPTGR